MDLSLRHLPPEVASRLRSWYLWKMMYRLLRFLAIWVIVYAAAVLVAVHLDRLLFLTQGFRTAMTYGVHAVAVLLGGLLVYLYVMHRPSVRQVAYELESRARVNPEERYVTLDSILRSDPKARDEITDRLVNQLTRDTVDHARDVHPAVLVRDRAMLWLAGVAVGLCLIFALLAIPAGYQFGLMLHRFYAPSADLAKPSFIDIQLSQGSRTIAIGQEAVIQADIAGQVPGPLAWLFGWMGMSPDRCLISIEGGAGGTFDFDPASAEDMARVQRTLFLYSRGDVQKTFRYRVRCGDAQTSVQVVRAVPRPEVTGLALEIIPPDYVKLDAYTVEDFDQPVRILPGSKVIGRFGSTQDVQPPAIDRGNRLEPLDPNWDPARRTGQWEFEFNRKQTFSVKLVNTDGFENVERRKVALEVWEDRPPTVRLEYPTGDLSKVPSELVPLRAVIEDDFGIEQVDVRYTLNPGQNNPPKDMPIELRVTNPRELNLSHMFELEKTRAVPGDVVSLELRARDAEGKDGTSRKISIRIVPFTRGDNERKRIAVLEWLRDSLARVGGGELPTTRPSGIAADDIDKAVGEAIANLAKASGVALGESVSFPAILDLLETELYLTDASWQKADLRRLAGVVREAAYPVGAGLADPLAHRQKVLGELTGGLMTDLIGYRHMKNLTWRLFGMRYEAGRIRGKLAELATMSEELKAVSQTAAEAGKEARAAALEAAEAAGVPTEEGVDTSEWAPEKAARASELSAEANDLKETYDALLTSATKRAELYFKTLQDMGEELLVFARQSEVFDANALSEEVQALNTDGYWLKRGSLTRRMQASDLIAGRINKQLRVIRGALPTLFQQHTAARAKLATMYDRRRQLLPAGPPEGQPMARWAEHAGEWVAADARLMKWAPFTPYWPRLTDLALGEWIADAAAGGANERAELASKGRSMVSPNKDLAGQIRDAGHVALALAADYYAEHVRSLEDISNTEKTYELKLLELEELSWLDRLEPAERNQRFEAIAEMDLTAEGQAPPARRDSRPNELLTEHPENVETLHAAGELRYPLASPATTVQRLLPKLEATDQMLKDVRQALAGGLSEETSARLAEMSKRLAAEEDLLRRATTRMALAVGYGPITDQTPANELLFLKVRQKVALYRGRAARPLAALKGLAPGGSNPGDMTALSSQVNTLVNSHQYALTKGLRDALADRKAGDQVTAADVKQYTILPEFQRTREYILTTRKLLAAEDPREIAALFVRQNAQAARQYIADRSELIRQARQAVNEAIAALAASPAEIDKANNRLSAAAGMLAEMAEAVSATGEGDLQAMLSESLSATANRLKRLAVPAEADETIIRSRRYDLGQIAQSITNTAREAEAAGTAAENSIAAFRGGPAGVTAEALAYQVEQARNRLIDQYRLANRRVTFGVLEGLSEDPDRQAFADAYAWAVYLRRVVRSDLYGLGSQRIGGREKTGSDLRDWLEAQIQEAERSANLQVYGQMPTEVLQTMKSLIRY